MQLKTLAVWIIATLPVIAYAVSEQADDKTIAANNAILLSEHTEMVFTPPISSRGLRQDTLIYLSGNGKETQRVVLHYDRRGELNSLSLIMLFHDEYGPYVEKALTKSTAGWLVRLPEEPKKKLTVSYATDERGRIALRDLIYDKPNGTRLTSRADYLYDENDRLIEQRIVRDGTDTIPDVVDTEPAQLSYIYQNDRLTDKVRRASTARQDYHYRYNANGLADSLIVRHYATAQANTQPQETINIAFSYSQFNQRQDWTKMTISALMPDGSRSESYITREPVYY